MGTTNPRLYSFGTRTGKTKAMQRFLDACRARGVVVEVRDPAAAYDDVSRHHHREGGDDDD